MANTKLSLENAASVLDGSELVRGVQAGADVKITANQLKTWAQTGLGAFATGTDAANLTGTIAIARIADGSLTYAKIQNVSATDKLLGRSTAGAGVVEEIVCTAAGRALIDDANAAAQRTTLGLGTAALVNMSVGTSAPGSPTVGDLWVDTN